MEIVFKTKEISLVAGVPIQLDSSKRAFSVALSCDQEFSIGDDTERKGALSSIELGQIVQTSGKVAQYDLKEIWVESTVNATLTIFTTEVKSVD